ncbi:hypothetical protein [Nocardioides alcanivorans]|uniref:hypothetical protein n=1 Tax=Nocardioides alcanivorans TaxID=2897352 RepID=UPI001F39DF13|nr:hypothetical protein [Nocardioides alcanivorans]
MGRPRFDVTPLTGPARGVRWHEFRAEAIAGRHGEDLARPRWWRRFGWAIATMLSMAVIVIVPVALMTTQGATQTTVLVSLGWVVCGMLFHTVAIHLPRQEFWGPRTRQRYRLTEFARANSLRYDPAPTVTKPVAYIFGSAPERRHLDRFEAPGPQGFVVANYEEEWPDNPDTDGFDGAYVIFRLRESYPRTFVSRDQRSPVRGLRYVTPIELGDGLHLWSAKPDHPLLQRLLASGVVERSMKLGRLTKIQIVGNELFVLRHGSWPLAVPRLWQRLAALTDAVAPFLDGPGRSSGAGALLPRQR